MQLRGILFFSELLVEKQNKLGSLEAVCCSFVSSKSCIFHFVVYWYCQPIFQIILVKLHCKDIFFWKMVILAMQLFTFGWSLRYPACFPLIPRVSFRWFLVPRLLPLSMTCCLRRQSSPSPFLPSFSLQLLSEDLASSSGMCCGVRVLSDSPQGAEA